MNKIFKQFAVKWKMPEDSVRWIYYVLQQNHKYGKTSHILQGFGVSLRPRQLKYFIRKIQFYNNYNIAEKGRPTNYSELMRKNT